MYAYGIYTFLYVTDATNARLYFQDGTFYCEDGPGYSCITIMDLGNSIETWACGNVVSAPEQPDPIEEEIFTNYPFLNDIIDGNNCGSTSIRLFDYGVYTFIYIENGNRGSLYFQDGTLYCRNTRRFNCINAYNLDEPSAIWNCDENNPLIGAKQNPDLEEPQGKLIKDFSVYPNPSNGSFYIDFVEPETIQRIVIYDLKGASIWEENVNNSTPVKIDLQNSLPAGKYMISIQSEQDVQTKPLIIN